MRVLSLFDGMSCGRIALERAGIPVEAYYASEIDKYAIKVAQANYPDTIQMGDIRTVRAGMLPQIDLILAGSPCQGFSFAGKQLNFEDDRSKLFFEFIRILKAYKPKYFLLENVVMSQQNNDVISSMLGELYPECITQKDMFRAGRLEPIQINSALVSAQNRNRLYWTNIPDVTQPEDRGILLEDILEDVNTNVSQEAIDYAKTAVFNQDRPVSMGDKAYTILSGSQKLYKIVSLTERRTEEAKKIRRKTKDRDFSPRRGKELVPRTDDKSNCLTKEHILCKIPVIKQDNELIYKPHKSQCLDANYYKSPDNHGQRTGCIEVGHVAGVKGHDVLKRVYSPKGKGPTLDVPSGDNRHKKIAVDACHWRKLTPIECERLQTVDDNYTNHVSNTQRYKMLGNGWTVDVIVHILRNMEL